MCIQSVRGYRWPGAVKRKSSLSTTCSVPVSRLVTLGSHTSWLSGNAIRVGRKCSAIPN